MIKEISMRVVPRVAATPSLLKDQVAREIAVEARRISCIRTLRSSIDARQRTIYVNLTIEAYIDQPAPDSFFEPIDYSDVSRGREVIVVGAGPGGLFAALRLIERGFKPIVLERGKDVRSRKKDIALISRENLVNPESNYAFGEGGAGAYSDGKLYTRSTKRGDVNRILRIFCQHGADPVILSAAHPHIGTDKLPRVIENMRNRIIESGGEVHFETRVDRLIIERDKVVGVTTADGREFLGPVILATGHSARDVYRMLRSEGVCVEQKGIAVGVRLEHPSMLVDQIMYHNREGRGNYLPAAEYRMTARSGGRGVYSFCMCPGGFVIPAASGPGQLVVNGMSPSGRNSKWSNSGMVVETRTEDVDEPSFRHLMEMYADDEYFATQCGDWRDENNPLRMMYLQEVLERLCWQQAAMTQAAPAQRMTDFVNKRLGIDLPSTSYAAGLTVSPLHFWLPDFITSRLREGFCVFGRNHRGFLTREATMMAVETRTSSPVRIVRDAVSLQHIDIEGLYPCGEGAGYAGGIVSAAIDGERCADAVV
ncbi:MAG: FAD-binding protein [Prevotellaceae bacterium]|nr:FAD-binding protein [Prevotellaceae bacterium]